MRVLITFEDTAWRNILDVRRHAVRVAESDAQDSGCENPQHVDVAEVRVFGYEVTFRCNPLRASR